MRESDTEREWVREERDREREKEGRKEREKGRKNRGQESERKIEFYFFSATIRKVEIIYEMKI